MGMKKEGAIAVDTNVAENAMIKIDNVTDQLLKNVKSTIGRKALPAKKKELLGEMNELMMSNPDGKGLRPVIETIEDES